MTEMLVRPDEFSPSRQTELSQDAQTTQQLFTEIPIEGAHIHSREVHGRLYIPDKPTSDTAVLFAPGFMEFQEATVPLAHAMASRGVVMMTMEPLREQPEESKYSIEHLKNPWLLQMQVVHALQKAVAKKYGIDQFDNVGHSMGNEEVLGAAYHQVTALEDSPVHVRSVMGDQGLGLDGGNLLRKPLRRIYSIATRDIGQSVPKLMKHRRKGFIEDAKRHIMTDPVRVGREGIKCLMRTDAHIRIAELRANGVKVGALVGGKDSFFPARVVRRHSAEHLDGIWEIPHADHLHANAFPEEHAEELIKALTELNDPTRKAA